MKKITMKAETPLEAAKILFAAEDSEFQNEAGYTVTTPEELAELLELGQDVHTVHGEWYWFNYEERK